MLDVEFLLAPRLRRKLVYRYKSGRLRHAMLTAIKGIAKSQNITFLGGPASDFANALSGFFQGLHWADLGNAKLAVIQAAIRSMAVHDAGPAAIFVRSSTSALDGEWWSELQQQATVIDEAVPTTHNMDAIVHYALSKSDLSPPDGLESEAKFRSYLASRSEMHAGIHEVLEDVDDFILTQLGKPLVAEEDLQPRVPEFALTTVLRRFLKAPGAQEERNLIDHALLRGDNARLVAGALTTSTVSLIGRRRDRDLQEADSADEALVLWSVVLLANHLGLAKLGSGYAPSWRANPDIRAFVAAQLCRDFRGAITSNTSRDRLVRSASDALATAPMLAASDEHAINKLAATLLDYVAANPQLPEWCKELPGALVGVAGLPRRAKFHLDVDFNHIEGQALVVGHLRRRIVEGKRAGAVLLYGRAMDYRDMIAFAWAKSILCGSPVDGAACNECESCAEVTKKNSPAVAVAHLGVDARQELRERYEMTSTAALHLDQRLAASSEEATADEQVRQVRQLIFQGGLWPGRRVIVLDGLDFVRKQAVDRLLKAIEEASASVSFLFLAERLWLVPAALRSRSMAFAIKPNAKDQAVVGLD